MVVVGRPGGLIVGWSVVVEEVDLERMMEEMRWEGVWWECGLWLLVGSWEEGLVEVMVSFANSRQ